MMKRKFLSLLLAICLIAGLLPVMMAGAETTTADAPAATPEATTATTTPSATQATTAPTAAATTATAAPSTAAPTPASTAAATAATETSKATRPATTPTTTPTEAAPTTPSTDAENPTAGAMSVSVKLCETSSAQTYLATLTAVKGGSPVYATTNDEGIPTLVTDGSVPTDNYIKFEYPQNDLPTITLMNAKLISSGNILDLSAFDIAVKIMVVGNSTLESSTKCGIVRASYGDITIMGPSKLTLNCYSSAIAFEGENYPNSLILKELTLKATTTSNASGRVFQIPAGNLSVDGSTLDLVNRAGIAVFLGQGSVADARSRGNAIIFNSNLSVSSRNAAIQMDGDLTIKGSNVQLASDARALYCGGNLNASNSKLYLEGRSNTQEAVNVAGDFNLRTSNAEIISTKSSLFSTTTLPNLIGDYTIIAGADRDTATTYDEALLATYQYLYAESVVGPTDQPTTPTGTETEPTEFYTEATRPPITAPPTSPTAAPITIPTQSNTTIQVNTPSNGNSVLFWILAVVMVLGAGGAATMAVMMIRKNAPADLDDEEDEDALLDDEEDEDALLDDDTPEAEAQETSQEDEVQEESQEDQEDEEA